MLLLMRCKSAKPLTTSINECAYLDKDYIIA